MPENIIPITAAPRRTQRRRRAAAIPAGAPLGQLLESWTLALQAAGKSKATIYSYTRAAAAFIDWLTEQGHPCDAEGVQAEHVRAWIVALREAGAADASLASYFAFLKVFFNWITAEDERTTPNPVLTADRPKVSRKAKRYLTADQIRALLKVCEGRDFTARRDAAIIRVLVDNGMRVGGLVSIRLDNVDLRGRTLKIVLKGGDEHIAPIGAKTAAAIDRYLRVRAAHPCADSPWLWLGAGSSGRERLGDEGVRLMLARRGEQAGIMGLHPHMFRGTTAHELLAAGASDGDVQHILGWRSRSMVEYYAGDLAMERARDVHARLSPGDRI